MYLSIYPHILRVLFLWGTLTHTRHCPADLMGASCHPHIRLDALPFSGGGRCQELRSPRPAMLTQMSAFLAQEPPPKPPQQGAAWGTFLHSDRVLFHSGLSPLGEYPPYSICLTLDWCHSVGEMGHQGVGTSFLPLACTFAVREPRLDCYFHFSSLSYVTTSMPGTWTNPSAVTFSGVSVLDLMLGLTLDFGEKITRDVIGYLPLW